MQAQGGDESKGVNDLGGNAASVPTTSTAAATTMAENLTAPSGKPPITDVSTTEPSTDRKARVVVEYVDFPPAAGEAAESDDEALGEDAGDPATEDLLAAMPDDTEEIDLIHARLHSLDALRLPRFSSHLKRLCLRQNFITKVGNEDVGTLKKLEELDLYDNKVKHLGSGLDGLEELQVLDLSFNLLRSVPSGLEQNQLLHTIYFVQNKITKISGVQGLANSLKSLELGGNRIRSIEGLEGLVNLEELWLGKNKITKLQGFETLKSLRVLSIQSNRITKLENLEELTNLEELYISHNGLETIEGLGKNVKLRTLDVSGNTVRAVAGISHLTELEEFWASDNQVATLNDLERELGGTKTLSTIYLERNPCERDDPTGYRRKIMLALPQVQQIDATYTRRA